MRLGDEKGFEMESSSSSSSVLVDGEEGVTSGSFFAGVVDAGGQVRKPWEFHEARKAARALEPGQTSVDEKVRQVLSRRDRAESGEEEGESDEEDEVEDEAQVVDQVDPDECIGFDELSLSKPLLKAVSSLGWQSATPVQVRTIPVILSGRDVCGSAVTGSGKTAAFVLPILERLLQGRLARSQQIHACTKVVILLPTRELAVQCQAVVTSLARFTGIRCAMAVGGLTNRSQEASLRTRPEIVVATPGRLIDHLRNTKDFAVDEVEILVMDEADRLLELGFKEEVEELLSYFSKNRQTLLFSATMTREIEWLVTLSLEKSVHIAVNPKYDVASTLSQEFVKIKGPFLEQNKDSVLLSLCARSFKSRVIVFFAQKQTAHRFKIIFGLANLRAAELHGNMTQGQRLEALEQFRDQERDFLLCTDLAARGLDILGVRTVINYDMPRTLTEYVHRVGRTARAGAVGRAVSLVEENDRKILKLVHKRAKSKLVARAIPTDVVESWRRRIDGMNADIESILRSEREEKAMRSAQVELAKADNLIQHADEIYSKPRRTWFKESDNEKPKKEKRKAQAAGDLDDLPNTKATRKQRRREQQVREKKEHVKQEREKSFAMQRKAARAVKKQRGR